MEDLYEQHPHVSVALKPYGEGYTFDIEVEPAYRGTGLGTAALWDLVDLADCLQVELHIHAEPDPEQQTLASLVAWYTQFGFSPVGKPAKGAQRMVRPL